MEELFPLVICLLIAFIGVITSAAVSSQKKAQQSAASQTETPRQPAAPQSRPQQQTTLRPRPQASPRALPRQHVSTPLEAHMHEPVMGQEGVGTEGIDCCHEYMLSSPEEVKPDFLPMTEESGDARARALLQGVIYSEILGRRPIRRFGGKRA